jgi:hypothetical protein
VCMQNYFHVRTCSHKATFALMCALFTDFCPNVHACQASASFAMRDSIHTMREPLQMPQIRERAHICSHSVEPALDVLTCAGHGTRSITL